MPTMPEDVHEVSDEWFLELYKSDKIVGALCLSLRFWRSHTGQC